MPESNNNFIPAPEVASVRNLIFAIDYHKKEKHFNGVFHTLYGIACILLLILSMMTGGTLGFVFSILAPVTYAYTLVSAPLAVKVLVPAFSVTGYAALCFLTDSSISLYGFLTLISCLLISVFLGIGVVKGHTKMRLLVTVTVILVVCFLAGGAVDMILEEGSFSPKGAVERLDESLEYASGQYIETAKQIIDEEAFDRLISEAQPETPITRDEFFSQLEKVTEMGFFAIKLSLPAVIVLIHLFKAFLIMEAFSVLVRVFRIGVFVCIADKFWTYRMPMICVNLYEIVLTVFIITSFFNVSSAFSAAILNILLILTPPMLLWGIRGIYTFLSSRSLAPFAAGILTALICGIMFALLNVWSVFLLGSIGVTALVVRNAGETATLPVMMAENAAAAEQFRRSGNNPHFSEGTKQSETHSSDGKDNSDNTDNSDK